MARKKLPISLTMIVKNEENFLDACLKSVQEMVSEIIIVDTGSTDRTKEIAERYGAKIYDFEWIDDFSAARNYALEKATQPWVLQLDADEEIFKGDLDWFYNTYPWKYEGYLLYIYNYKKDRAVMDAHYLIRFFKNKPGNRYHYRIHENLILESGKAAISKARIFHKGYATREDDERKAQRNYKHLMQRLKEYPDDPLSHFYFAQLYAGFGNFIKGSAPARKCLKLNAPMPIKAMALRIAFIGALQEKKAHKFKEVLSYCPNFKEFPDRLLYEAKFIGTSDVSRAKSLIDTYIEIAQKAIEEDKFGKVEYIIPDNYVSALSFRAQLFEEQNYYDEALSDLNEALQYSQSDFGVIIRKAGLLLRSGRIDDAIEETSIAIDELENMPNQPEGLLQQYYDFIDKLKALREKV